MQVDMFSFCAKAPQLSETLEAPSGIVGVRTCTCSLLVPAGCVGFFFFKTPEQVVCTKKQASL